MFSRFKEVYRYREMLFLTVKKDLRSRYRGSVLGFLWTFINPLLQLVVYSIVFPHLLRVSEEHYSMYVFSGLLPWIYLTSSLQIATTCITGNSNLVKKIYFPRIILPLSVSLTGVVNLCFGLVILLAALCFEGIFPSVYLAFLPVVLLVQFLFVSGICFILSSAYVYFRDLEHIVSIVTMAWFYLTPVVFTLNTFPPTLKWIMDINPMTSLISAYRDIFLYKRALSLSALFPAIAVSALLFIFGASLFGRMEKRFAEEI